MNVQQQLKKRQIKDKKGNVKGYLGKPKFKANPNIKGYAGTQIIEKENGDAEIKYNVNKIAKARELLAEAKTQKAIKKLQEEFKNKEN